MFHSWCGGAQFKENSGEENETLAKDKKKKIKVQHTAESAWVVELKSRLRGTSAEDLGKKCLSLLEEFSDVLCSSPDFGDFFDITGMAVLLVCCFFPVDFDAIPLQVCSPMWPRRTRT